MDKKKYDVIVVGELNVDIILNDIDSFPEIGKEKLAGKMDTTLGSSSAILASNLSSLGAKVAFIGKIGQDSAFVKLVSEGHNAEKAKLLTRQFWHFQEQYGDPAFTPDILSTIEAKWLVIQGDNDEFVPLQQALEMHQYIPNSWLWIVPNGGHLPHLNTDFQSEFLKVSLEFLNGKWDKND